MRTGHFSRGSKTKLGSAPLAPTSTMTSLNSIFWWRAALRCRSIRDMPKTRSGETAAASIHNFICSITFETDQPGAADAGEDENGHPGSDHRRHRAGLAQRHDQTVRDEIEEAQNEADRHAAGEAAAALIDTVGDRGGKEDHQDRADRNGEAFLQPGLVEIGGAHADLVGSGEGPDLA